uniref:Anaphase-promoting complex subunit 4 WD40 domain-containing protein n=1 Tax=Dunaliella tertiolecta TaxID=3047 RepID=A0A7S3VU90_DUNTE|mmetsp:Transcript_18628/g.52368  ORF Transcript_18628/g.52368 Transcript_18628/m.52368 type:complete len:722 (+) Transcript_18628:181-2346(+)
MSRDDSSSGSRDREGPARLESINEGSTAMSDDIQMEGDTDDTEEEQEFINEEDEDLDEVTPAGLFTWLLGTRSTQGMQSSLASKFRKLEDVVVLPLQEDLAQEVNLRTSAVNKRKPCDAPSLDQGLDIGNARVRHPGPKTTGVQDQGVLPPPSEAAQAAAAAGGVGIKGLGHAAPEQTVNIQGRKRSIASEPDGLIEQQQHGPCGSAGGTHGSGRSSNACTGSTRSSTRLQAQRERQQAATGCVQNPEASKGTSRSDQGSTKDGQASSSCQIPSGLEQVNNGEAGACAHQGSLLSSSLPPDASGWVMPNIARLLSKREMGLGDGGSSFSKASCRHLQCRSGNLPTQPKRQVDDMDSRAYIGQFSDMDGRFFVAAYQDQRVRLYDVEKDWELRKDVRARGIRWTITDTCLSPDQRFLLYSSISPTVHLLALGASWDVVESLANVTEVHESLDFDPEGHERFGIWSLAWSGDGREIIAGTNNESVYIYDVATSTINAKVSGHKDDVNAVTYLDSTPNLILSGSDDSMIKLWDRRLVSNEPGSRNKAVGTMVGHTEGITHLNSRGDGRYFISNSKDQCIKLWDTRKSLRSERETAMLPREGIPQFNWDYRWMAYPARGYDVRHPHDASVMTYRGHQVHQTLIRAYFSPSHTTGQRFIYAGSADCCVYLWDVVTGKMLHRLRHHRSLVRDVGWHPYEPMIGSVSWDGTAMVWGPPNFTGSKNKPA